MGRIFAAIAGASLVGCAQLAGIDETSAGSEATFQVERVSIGATIVTAPEDLTDLYAQYYVPDPTQDDGILHVDGVLGPMDTWSARVEGTPPLVYDLPDKPDPLRRMMDIGVRNVETTFGALEHPNPEPAPMGAMLTVKAALPSPYALTESFQLYTLGAWSARSFSGMDLPMMDAPEFGPVTFAYDSASTPTGRHDKITTADAAMFLRYTGSKLTGVMEAAPFDQTGMDSIMGTMTAVTADQMLDVMVGPPATVTQRFAPVRPAVGAPSLRWALHAAPGADYAMDIGPQLEAGSVLAADSGALKVPYGNPFVAKGWRTVFTWQTVGTRTFTPPSALPVTLEAMLVQFVEPAAGLALDLPAGLPEVITLDSKPMSTDGLKIPAPTAPVTVSFVAGITDNTIYGIELYELVPNAANTALVQKLVIAAQSSKPEVTFAPELFEPGKLYNLRAICVQGAYTDVASGDLRMRQLPTTEGFLDGGVFQVMP